MGSLKHFFHKKDVQLIYSANSLNCNPSQYFKFCTLSSIYSKFSNPSWGSVLQLPFSNFRTLNSPLQVPSLMNCPVTRADFNCNYETTLDGSGQECITRYLPDISQICTALKRNLIRSSLVPPRRYILCQLRALVDFQSRTFDPYKIRWVWDHNDVTWFVSHLVCDLTWL